MNPEDHSNVVVVGNDATGTWLKLTAIATAEDLAQAIAEVRTNRRISADRTSEPEH